MIIQNNVSSFNQGQKSKQNVNFKALAFKTQQTMSLANDLLERTKPVLNTLGRPEKTLHVCWNEQLSAKINTILKDKGYVGIKLDENDQELLEPNLIKFRELDKANFEKGDTSAAAKMKAVEEAGIIDKFSAIVEGAAEATEDVVKSLSEQYKSFTKNITKALFSNKTNIE